MERSLSPGRKIHGEKMAGGFYDLIYLLFLEISRHCVAHTARCLCKHWCLAFAMYLRCLGGVESKTSKALFWTVSFEAKDISSPLLPSISIYLTQHLSCFLVHQTEKTQRMGKHHELNLWLVRLLGDGSPVVSLQSTTVFTDIAPIGTSSITTL